MEKGKIYTMPLRRKRQMRTNYKKRLRILMSNKVRLVVRKSLKNLQVSLIDYSAKGDKILFTINSTALGKLGWKFDCGNIPSAYLTGMLAGKKAIEKGVKEAVLDLGFNTPSKGSRLYAALAGAIDAGLKVPFDKEVLPTKERISGEHIVKYLNLLKNDKIKYEKQFSVYTKKGLNSGDLVKHFNEIKGKING